MVNTHTINEHNYTTIKAPTISMSEKNDMCANCGKGEEDKVNLKKCGACLSVKYCSAVCQKAHRPLHKKACKKRVAEMHDEQLFKVPPPPEDCPICFLRMPWMVSGSAYMQCCGKTICCGCVHSVQLRDNSPICPFCRVPRHDATSDGYKEIIKQYKNRMEHNDAEAICAMAGFYDSGNYGVPQSTAKALELWHRAGELGSATSYNNIAVCYHSGRGVARDKKKAVYYWELAAMRGCPTSRNNLGSLELNKRRNEGRTGNVKKALMHYMIAARDGDTLSLKNIKNMYIDGYATKDDYAKALRGYQAFVDEIRSDQRDEAAAIHDYRYYESAV